MNIKLASLIILLLISMPAVLARGHDQHRIKDSPTDLEACEDTSALRDLTKVYFQALRKKDWEYLNGLFLQTRTDLIGVNIGFNISLDSIQRSVRPTNIDFLSYSINKVVVGERSGAVYITLSIRATDPQTGNFVINLPNLERVIYCERLNCYCAPDPYCGWRIRRDSSNRNSLATAVLAAKSINERRLVLSGATYEEFQATIVGLKRRALTLLDSHNHSEAFRVFHVAQGVVMQQQEIDKISTSLKLKERRDEVARIEGANDKRKLASSLHWAGTEHENAGFYKEAVEYYLRCLALYKEFEDQRSVLKTYQDIAEAYRDQGDYTRAIDYFLKSLDQYHLIGPEDGASADRFDPDDVTLQIGLFYDMQGEDELALKYYMDVADKARAAGDVEEAGGILFSIGLYYFRRGDFSAALSNFKKALDYLDKPEAKFDEKGEVLFFVNWMSSILCLEQNDYEQGAIYLRMARNNLRAASQDVGQRDLIRMLEGALYNTRADESVLMPTIQRMMNKIVIQLLDEYTISDLLNTVALEYESENNSILAEQCFSQSLELAEELGDKALLGRTHLQTAAFYSAHQNTAKTMDHYEMILQLGQDPSLNNSEKVAIGGNVENALYNMAGFLQSIGENEKALEYYRRLLNLKQMRFFKAFDDSIHYNIAQIYYQQGKYKEAIESAERAISLAARQNDRETLTDSLNLCGIAYWWLDSPLLARQSFEKAINVIESTRPLVIGGEQSLQHFFEDKLIPYHHFISWLVSNGDNEGAFHYSERSKSRVLLDILRQGRKSFLKDLSPAERAQEQNLKSRLDSLNQRVLAMQHLSSDDARLKSSRIERLEVRLDYEIFRANVYASHPTLTLRPNPHETMIQVEEAAKLLPSEETALLEFLVTKYRTYLFVLTKNKNGSKPEGDVEINRGPVALKVYTLEIAEEDLKGMVEDFRQRVAHPYGVVQPLARELYNILLEPASEQLARVDTLVIVPDGLLWELPFQALQPTDEHYLLEDYNLYFAPSLTSLHEMQNGRSKSGPFSSGVETKRRWAGPSVSKPLNLLAIGISEFGRQRTVGNNARLTRQLPPLLESEKLARRLVSLYGRSRATAYTGAAANERRVKTVAQKYRILHFGSHGLLDDDNPMYSSIVLSQVLRKGSKLRKVSPGNGPPFILRDGEDGILEAWELMDLELNADLTILSACNTARGRVGIGEGMVGMAWALFIAGCPTTIVSQWQVDENSTADTMFEFHKLFLEQRQSQKTSYHFANTLRRAALTIKSRAEYGHPYYWASFIIIGDGR